jgi:hypothetical protein
MFLLQHGWPLELAVPFCMTIASLHNDVLLLRNSGEVLTDGETLGPGTQSGAATGGAQSGAGTTALQVSEDWGEIKYESACLWWQGDLDWISLFCLVFDSKLLLTVASNTFYYMISPV